jgi:heme a synthase
MDFQPSPSPTPAALARPNSRPGGDLLAIGFGTTVAMWGTGYVGHMPLTQLPPAVFGSLMLVCLVVGGWTTGRYTLRGVIGGALVGLIAATLNLLILGSLLSQPQSTPLVPAWLWMPGWFALSMVLAGGGAAVGCWRRPAAVADIQWPAVFAWVTVAAALLLIAVGGLVTGFRAGMAVPDWPNTYHMNMFLFPFGLMTGGVFYEHAHRLLGSLTGIATLTLALFLTLRMPHRKGVLAVVWLTGSAVAVQGILGGFRVTRDSYALAVTHGFFAHAILGGLVVAAVLLSRRWESRDGCSNRPGASTDRLFTVLLAVLVLVQTLLGVLLRQLNVLLLVHITVATLVVLVGMGAAMRAWGLNPTLAALRRGGVLLMWLILLQIVLGIVSVVFRTPSVDKSPSDVQLQARHGELPNATLPALVTTCHQTNAAAMLGVAVVLALWTWRFVEEETLVAGTGG